MNTHRRALLLLIFFLALRLTIADATCQEPLTNTNGINLTTPASGNYEIIGFKVTTNVSNATLTNVGLAAGVTAPYLYVLNSSHAIICKWAAGTATNCSLPYAGVYRVGAAKDDGAIYNKAYTAYTSYPISGQLITWDADTYVACTNWTVGSQCSTPSDYTTYAENVQSITFAT